VRNLGDESWDANNPPLEQEEAVANPTAESEENHDAEVTRLFEDARDKLESIEASSKKQKRQIVVELAKSLEGKIATESICADIVSQLHGQVSAGFIRECLDEKYKQKHRLANARKQQKMQRKGQQHEPGSTEDLAKVTTLNQEDDKVKKELIILDVGGRAVPQENKDEQNDEAEDDEQSSIPGASSTAKHGSLTEEQSHHSQEHQQQQQEEQGDAYNHDSPNNSPCLEDDEGDAEPEEEFEVSLQPDGQDGTDDISAQNNKPNELKGDVMDFEFHMLYGRVSKYMAPLFQKIGDGGKVWFCGKIDKKTGKVISSSLGRLSQQ
jgi:hypothetical protein